MRTWGRQLVITIAAAASLTGLAGCADGTITQADAYKIGCPAVDAVVGGGSLGSKASVAGLKKLREQPDLSPETTKWLDAAIGALETTDPNDMPKEAKALLVDGCQDNGYPLRNLAKG
ncbi:MAG: hypothetical protein ABWY56_01560 [Propionibacteriaceae bacterium]